jgi:hypothetical protein
MTKEVPRFAKRWPLFVDDGHLLGGQRRQADRTVAKGGKDPINVTGRNQRKADRIEKAVNAVWAAKKRLFATTSRKSLPYWQEILIPG